MKKYEFKFISDVCVTSEKGKKAVAELLKIDKNASKRFEEAYSHRGIEPSDNLFSINAKDAKSLIQNEDVSAVDEKELAGIVDAIVNDLCEQTAVWKYDGEEVKETTAHAEEKDETDLLSKICALPEKVRPQLTGEHMSVDMSEPSFVALVDTYIRYLKEKNPAKKTSLYGHFRQGLDILDLDPITYQIIDRNINSIGYWLPQIISPVREHGCFKIPKTTIIKVPITLLQLTRCDYFQLTKPTLDIVDRYCSKVFDLDENGDYFVKTGTFSSKYDFRNAHVTGAEEIRTLGEYLLFIHFQALEMASPLSKPCIYGASTTVEWAVREYIKDVEDNPCIYNGMPLHTEYRVFVDFDAKKVIGVTPYWEPNVMKERFSKHEDANEPDKIHDFIIYSAHEETLMKRYNDNVDTVVGKISELIQDIDMTGQWSIDIMQNGNDFWIIDMGVAALSALKECVPKGLLKPNKEDWIPALKGDEVQCPHF